jgi:hypothetical protein
MDMEQFRMETPRVTAYWEDTQDIFYVIYREALSREVTTQVYQWMIETSQALKDKEVLGGIYDFRQVIDAESGNLAALHRESRNFNVKVDTSHTPIALIVENLHQEQIVRISMQVTPGQKRKRIVKSMDDALKFIQEYHAKPSKTD